MNLLALSPEALSRLRVAIWVMVGLQTVLALGTLAASGAQASGMTGLIHLPGVPGKLGYSIFISLLTFLVLPTYAALQYFKPSWWVSFMTRFDLWPMLVSGAIFVILWIAATGSAFFSCGDMCGTVGSSANIFIKYTSSLCCVCDLGVSSSVTCQEGSSQGKYNQILGQENDVRAPYQATQAFSILNMLLFMASTAIWIIIFLNTQSRSNDAEMAEQGADSANMPMSYSAGAPSDEEYHTYKSQSTTVISDIDAVDGRQSPYSHGRLPYESRQSAYASAAPYDQQPYVRQPEGPYDGRGYGPPPLTGPGSRM